MRVIRWCQILALCAVVANGQVLRLVRTDPVPYPTIATATKLIGFDIVADSISNVTAVAFELRFSGAQYVRLSAWKPRDLGRNSVYVVDLSDTVTGTGSIHVGVLSGEPSSGIGVNSPTVLHIDFVVLPDVPHRTLITFEAVGAEAIVAGIPARVVPLRSELLAMTIHSFVTVYPGDANNDGRVNLHDFSTVALYLGEGTASGQLHGYRRIQPSTLWEPQQALAWDNESVTYADCDGSGDITLADALVVEMNFDSTHAVAQPPYDDQRQYQRPLLPSVATYDILIPIGTVKAVALEFELSGTDAVQLEALDQQWSLVYVGSSTPMQRLWCVARAVTPLERPILRLGVRSSSPSITTHLHCGYARVGNAIVPLAAELSNIHDQMNNQCPRVFPQPASHTIAIESAEFCHAVLYAADGRAVQSWQLQSGSALYQLDVLDSGIYWLVSTQCTQPIVIVR
ncbi:MAG: dockerin type I domain-containing protein [Chlorobi bacterium]|nr:dockerin type I domain-containing protein [Chlorobiota bacterium]